MHSFMVADKKGDIKKGTGQKIHNRRAQRSVRFEKKELVMKMKIFLVILFFVLSIDISARVVPLPEVIRPHDISVDNNQLYICEHEEISIYSLKDFKLIKKFGKKGEGPQEFKSAVHVNCQSDHLIVESIGKLSFYSKTGEFRDEIKNSSLFIRSFVPVGNQFVALEYNFRDKLKVIICNSKLNKIKEIFTEEQARKRGSVFNAAFRFRKYNDKVYIASGKNFVICVLDITGKELFSITKDYKLLTFTQEHANQFLEAYRNSPITKEFYEGFKKIVEFPDYFPAINDFFVADGKVYAQTHNEIDKKSEFFIFDEDGKFLKTVFLPVTDKDFMTPSTFDIGNGKLYNLFENEDTEEWELHVTEIN